MATHTDSPFHVHHDSPTQIGRRERLGVRLLIVADGAFVFGVDFFDCWIACARGPGPRRALLLPPGEDPVFKPGDRVRTTGLRNRVDLNDRSGFILSFQNGRFAVSLAGCDRPVLLLPQNVLPCDVDEDSGSGCSWSSRGY